jgi:hypothetical protein
MISMTPPVAPATAADALLALLELVNNPAAAADRIRSLREQETASQVALTQSNLKLAELAEAQRAFEVQRRQQEAEFERRQADWNAERARREQDLQVQSDQLAAARTALEAEKQAAEKLKASLERRMARITAAAA